MRIRSRALYDYLLEQGVLYGPEEAIMRCKADYRRLYKAEWKKRSRPRKEIRFEITLKQFQSICAKANAKGMRHTTYIKSIALNSIGEPMGPDERLLEVLQKLSMGVTATSQYHATECAQGLLLEAEALLLTYLKIGDK